MSAEKSPSDAQCRAALMAVESAWNAACSPWRPQSLAALYTDDAFFFGGRPGHSVGHEAVLAYFASYEGVLKSVRMRLVEQRLAPLAPALVLAQGFVEFDFELADDRHSATRMRTTLILIEQGGQWRIRQHHFSMEPDKPPIDGD